MLVECRIVHDRRLIFVQSATASTSESQLRSTSTPLSPCVTKSKGIEFSKRTHKNHGSKIFCINYVTLIMNLMKMRISITGKYSSKMQKSLLNIEHQAIVDSSWLCRQPQRGKASQMLCSDVPPDFFLIMWMLHKLFIIDTKVTLLSMPPNINTSACCFEL